MSTGFSGTLDSSSLQSLFCRVARMFAWTFAAFEIYRPVRKSGDKVPSFAASVIGVLPPPLFTFIFDGGKRHVLARRANLQQSLALPRPTHRKTHRVHHGDLQRFFSAISASFKSSIFMFFMRSFALNTFACRSTFFFNMSDNCSQFCSDFSTCLVPRARSSVTSLDGERQCRLACSDSCWYLECHPSLFSFVCFS